MMHGQPSIKMRQISLQSEVVVVAAAAAVVVVAAAAASSSSSSSYTFLGNGST